MLYTLDYSTVTQVYNLRNSVYNYITNVYNYSENSHIIIDYITSLNNLLYVILTIIHILNPD